MKNPTISVLMSVYKEPVEWLCQSIDSILQQTFTDFEYIIVCDNPTYIEGISVLNDYSQKDSRIQLLFNKENIGLTKSLNKGLKVAKGEYIARMDADDISKPDRFEKQVAYMEAHPDCGVCGTKVIYIGDVKWWRKPQSDWIKISDDDIKGRLLISSSFAHSSVIMRRMMTSIYYDESFRRSQDYELWTRLADTCVFHNLPQKLLYYRVSPGQMSSQSTNQYSHEIRRRYLIKVLQRSGIELPHSNDELSLSSLYDRIELIRNNRLLTISERNNVIQIIYFSRNENRSKALYKALFTGDFWRFPALDKFRFILMSFGIREPMKL